ncbi:hypothetical protein [Loigolactobacillus zhaoyuanensis]|uniref:Uncharacterized protein n=1 Tax=Loigolactobacillus zhaoyuanensis TaxID=2486017 RepID=A0ABW8U9W8_9LACO
MEPLQKFVEAVPWLVIMLLIMIFPCLVYIFDYWRRTLSHLNSIVLLSVVIGGFLGLLGVLWSTLWLLNTKLLVSGYVDAQLNKFSLAFYFSIVGLAVLWAIVNILLNVRRHQRQVDHISEEPVYSWLPTLFAWWLLIIDGRAVIGVYLLPQLHLQRGFISLWAAFMIVLVWWVIALYILQGIDYYVHRFNRRWATTNRGRNQKNWFLPLHRGRIHHRLKKSATLKKRHRRPALFETDANHIFSKSGDKAANIAVENLKINVILAIYTFVLAIVVPIVVLSALLIGGQQFNPLLYLLIVIGVVGVILATISLIYSRRNNLRTTGSILALVGTIMVATGIMMLPFFIVTPLLIVADWFLLHPVNIAAMTPTGKQIVQMNAYGSARSAKRRIKQIVSGNTADVKLPISFYFNTDFILKLIPIVGIATISIYVFIWIMTRDNAQPGSTPPMLISLALVLVVFVIGDLIVWFIWKRVARPIVTLGQRGLSYRKRRQQFFVSWNDITDLMNVVIPTSQISVSCLFIFANDPAKYIDTSLHFSPQKEKFERWLHGIRPEYFQNDFAGVVLTIPIDQLGIEPQIFLNLVTNLWKQNDRNLN